MVYREGLMVACVVWCFDDEGDGLVARAVSEEFEFGFGEG